MKINWVASLVRNKLYKPNSDFDLGLYSIDKSWDSFPSPIPDPSRKAFFSGRDDLVQKLSNWLISSGGGSVLVSGARGIGKTAFTYYSINQAHLLSRVTTFENKMKAHFLWMGYIKTIPHYVIIFIARVMRIFVQRPKIVFVPINAAKTKYESENEQWNLLREILSGLIFSSCPAKKELNNIYFRSISDKGGTDFTKHISYEVSLLTKSVIPFLDLITFVVYPLLLSFQVTLVKELVSKLIPENIITNIRLIPAGYWFGLIGITVATHLLIQASQKKDERLTIDNKNFDYLYIKFNEFLSHSHDIFIFVIDEVDKLINPSENENKPEKLNKLIEDLKNLFTISTGRFIFITNDKYAYSWAGDCNPQGEYYPKSSTLFNWAIFLTSIDPYEILDYLSKITGTKADDQTLNTFAFYLYAKTGGIFSKVKDEIRSLVKYKDKSPYLDLSREAFSTDNIRLARMGNILYNVYSQDLNIQSTSQKFNYLKGEVLFAVFQELISLKQTKTTSVDELCNSYNDRAFKYFSTGYEQDLAKSAIKDLIQDIYDLSAEKPVAISLPDQNNLQFNFDFNIKQVVPTIFDLPKFRNLPSSTLHKLRGELSQLDDELDAYAHSMQLENQTIILHLIDKETVYNSAVTVSQAYNIRSYNDQENIQNRVNEIGEIRKSLKDKMWLLKQYLRRFYENQITVLVDDDVKLLLAGLNNNLKNEIIANSIFISGTENLTLIYLPIVVITNIDNIPFTKIGLNNKVQTGRFRFLATNQKASGLLKRIGVSSEEIDSVLLDTHLHGVGQIIVAINKYFHFSPQKAVVDDWQAVTKAENAPWMYDLRQIISSQPGIFGSLELTCNSGDSYWRAGIVFGCQKETNMKPLGGGQYPLIHLYKNIEGNTLHYKRIGYGTLAEQIFDQPLEISSSEAIKVAIIRKPENYNLIEICVNDRPVDKIRLKLIDFKNIWLLGWGDGNNFQVNFTSINYSLLKKQGPSEFKPIISKKHRLPKKNT